MKKYNWLYPLIFASVFVGGIWLGIILSGSGNSRLFSGRAKTNMAGREKIMNVLNLIEERYVDEVNIDSLVEMSLPAILSNLDPHSSYISAKDFETVNSELESKFSGIGISFRILNDTVNVIEVISGGPSEKVGLMPGDRIIMVDGKDITKTKIGMDDDVMKMLRGDKGTHVSVTVKRSNTKQPITFEITRDDIPVESIDAAYMIEPNVGFIRISKFARNTYSEFLQAINKLRIKGAESFIIDLRNNTGGFMDPAVLMANEFLAPGNIIVSTKGKVESENRILEADNLGAFSNYGLVILVNEFSASASEIFSGAIQDNDRGWIVGRRTFGKGLVQSPIVLPDSSEIRLTIQRYYTPSGRCIQKDYKPGDVIDYESELYNRFTNGENLSADSIKLDIEKKFSTRNGRMVYGGGGIMPDIFVPEDTSMITSYYVTLVNESMPIKYAYEYCDLNREKLQKAKNVDELMSMLPSDDELLNRFANYAAQNGVNKRPVYLNISRPLILSQVKALIARNILGMSAYFEVYNKSDKTVIEALKYVNKPVIVNSNSSDNEKK